MIDLPIVPHHLLQAKADQAAAKNTRPSRRPNAPSTQDWAARTDGNELVNEAISKISELGGRNHAGFYLACQLRDEGYSESEAESFMFSFAHSVPDSGSYPESEASNSLRQAFKDAPRTPRTQPGQGHSHGTGNSSSGYGPSPDSMTWTVDDGTTPESWPYGIQDGSIVFIQERTDKDGNPTRTYTTVSDFTATITAELTSEDKRRFYIIEGFGKRGGKFSIDIPAETFGEDRRLRSLLESVNPVDPVRAGQVGHLGPAIKLMSTQESVKKMNLYRRTGWQGDETFLIPGREPKATRIELFDKLAYQFQPDYAKDLDQGLITFDALIRSFRPELTTIALAMLFQAPAAQPAGWTNERYAIFIQGRTGSLKTSWTQSAMCIYGPNFIRDERLIKLGIGATPNAAIAIAAQCYDLPYFVDNFKLNSGGLTARDLISVIHSLMEGGEKDRLNTDATLKDFRALRCWPIFTGEDIPDSDPASIARILSITLDFQRGQPNETLSFVQEHSASLNAIGSAWLHWLTGDGYNVAAEVGALTAQRRAHWAAWIQSHYPNSANILRVATNIATNELAWNLLCLHPTLGAVASKYTAKHTAGLINLAHEMGRGTSESVEAVRYISALRDLLTAGQATLAPRTNPIDTKTDPRERIIGFEDDDYIYILPSIARDMVGRLLGNDWVAPSAQVLYAQFRSLGIMDGDSTKQVKINGQKKRLICFYKGEFWGETPENEDLGL